MKIFHYKIENYNVSFKTKMNLNVSFDVGAIIDTIPVPAKRDEN